jgi:IS605 OrfB family transposase
MKRAVRVTLKFATAKKRQAIDALLSRYRSAVNFFISSLWKDCGKLDKTTLARFQNTELSSRYKSQALKQALDIVVATRKASVATGKNASCPVFCGAAILDAKFVSVESGDGSFDLIVRVSSLVPRQRITIPTRKTAVANKWTSIPEAQWIQGCALSEDSLVLWIEIPDCVPKADGRVLAVDIGLNKLLSDSDGNHYGREFKVIRDKINRSKPKSKARYRHFRERTNYINFAVNQLPFRSLFALGVEDLSDMKHGKQKGRGKNFRKAIAAWTYREVLNRISCKAAENRVRLLAVDPANTSRTCPECGCCEKENRNGEDFACVRCGHRADADSVGARNVLARTLATLGSVESPGPIKDVW